MADWTTTNRPCGELHGSNGIRKDGKPMKRNQYAATCWVCQRTLAPGQGRIEFSKGEWVAFCLKPSAGGPT